jgi:RNA polymerase sigma-70 factor (ECF subfamily)
LFAPHGSIIINRMQDTGQNDRSSRRPSAQFETTRWSVVYAAGHGDDPQAREAWGTLVTTYWYPLYAFIRKQGYSAHETEDLVQGFLTRLIEKRDLAKVDQSKGRLRSFLMAACANYLRNQHDWRHAQKRGGDNIRVSIDYLDAEMRYAMKLTHELTAERSFERQWALQLLQAAADHLAQIMADQGKAELFERLRPALTGQRAALDLNAIADQLGTSSDAVGVAAARLRQRYGQILRKLIAETVSGPEQVDNEINELFKALHNPT